ncbi:hypothetical protein EJB05_10982, partial [Eragrostis curvula]
MGAKNATACSLWISFRFIFLTLRRLIEDSVYTIGQKATHQTKGVKSRYAPIPGLLAISDIRLPQPTAHMHRHIWESKKKSGNPGLVCSQGRAHLGSRASI